MSFDTFARPSRFNKSIALRGDQCVRLFTNSLDSHLNLVIEAGMNLFVPVTLTPQDAMELRDALNSAYPTASTPRVMGVRTRCIVALDEGGQFKPSSSPVIHTSEKSAADEAIRLAMKVGQDFTVLRPVLTAKAEVIKRVNVNLFRML